MLLIWTDPKFSRSVALSHKDLGFLHVCSTSPLKTLWEKEEFLVTSNFSFFSTVVYTLLENLPHFSSHLNCRLQSISIWKSLKFVVRERVKASPYTALFFITPRANPRRSLSGVRMCYNRKYHLRTETNMS